MKGGSWARPPTSSMCVSANSGPSLEAHVGRTQGPVFNCTCLPIWHDSWKCGSMACVCPMQGVSLSEGGQAGRLAVIFPKAQEDYLEGGNSSQAVTAVMTHDSLASHIAAIKRLFFSKPQILITIIKNDDKDVWLGTACCTSFSWQSSRVGMVCNECQIPHNKSPNTASLTLLHPYWKVLLT